MRFADFLRTTVLISAAAASALAAVTLAGAVGRRASARWSRSPPAGGWLAGLIGLWLGRRAETSPPIATLLASARSQPSLPEVNPPRVVLNRLWPLLLSTLGAGALGVILPQVPAIAAGFAIIWALAWRRQSSAVTAIEERDGARFYVERTSPLRPDPAGAHPGLSHQPAGAQRLVLVAARPARSDVAMAVPGPDGAIDVLIVSVGATTGWRAAARELGAAFERAGARTVTVDAGPVREVRTFMLTDLVQARAARRAAARGIAEHRPRAVVYCSITAALLWPRPGAIWLDAIAAENRPGRHGVWQRVVERRRLAQAPLVLTMAPDSLAPLGAGARRRQRRGAGGGRRARGRRRTRATSTSSPTPPIRSSAGWTSSSRPGGGPAGASETLVVAGIDARRPTPRACGSPGALAPDEYRALLRRARVFVAAPRREDFGIAQLEALADGAMLVTTPAPGPYPALALARELDPRLVAEDLAPALRAALDDPAPGYAARAAELVAPFSREAVAATLSQHVLPRLLPGWGA